MLNWLLEAVGLIASLIGIWEFVFRSAVSRKIAGRMSRAIEKKSFAIRKSLQDHVADHVAPLDPETVAEATYDVRQRSLVSNQKDSLHGPGLLDAICSLRRP